MRSSSSSLLFRRRGQGKRGESSDEKASTMTSTSAPKQHRDPSTSTSLASSLVQVEPLHALSSAALHTTSLRSAAQALRAGPPLVPERDNTPLEELFAVVTMASLFGFVFLGPWLTLAALVDVLSRFSSSSPSPPSSSPSPTFYFSLAFLSCVAALTFLPVYPSGSWSYFRDARVWDCWRRYFKMKVVSPPLPFLEGVDEEEEEKEREEKSSGADSPRVTREGKAKAYIFAHYPHGCFPVGSFLSAVGLLGCPGTGLPAGTRPAVASALLRLPVLRQVYTWCNCVPCDSKTLSNLLRSGTSIGVIPEGIAGIFHGSSAAKVPRLKNLLPSPPPSPRLFGGRGGGGGRRRGAPAAAPEGERSSAATAAAATAAREERIFTKHKGYIKLALRTGAEIVPVYALGHSRVLSFWGFPRLSRKLRMSLGIWWGRFGLPCLPRKEELVMVVCPPIDVGEARGEPTQEEIDAVFEKVARSLKRAHDETKSGVKGWENSEMVFCE